MKRVIFNQKGGVGKSSIAVNLAAIAASHGKRTLLIDLDPQCNSSRYLLGETVNDTVPTLGAYFEQVLSFSMFAQAPSHYVHPTPFENLSVIVAHPELGDLQSKLESRNKIYKLRDLLRELGKEYDEIYLDTPPAYNFFSQSALIAADSCLIPFDCDDFSRRALYNLLDNVQEIRADHNGDLQVSGIVVNQFQPRATLPQKLVQELIDEGLPVLRPYLSASVKVKESHQQARPMIHLDARHKLTQELQALHDCLSA